VVLADQLILARASRLQALPVLTFDARFSASLVMFSFLPRCEIRQLAVFVYPTGIKAHDA
jgi:hypothetical protein